VTIQWLGQEYVLEYGAFWTPGHIKRTKRVECITPTGSSTSAADERKPARGGLLPRWRGCL